jgi:hypothetical protein
MREKTEKTFSENEVVASIELEGLERFQITNFSPMQSREILDELKKSQGIEYY